MLAMTNTIAQNSVVSRDHLVSSCKPTRSPISSARYASERFASDDSRTAMIPSFSLEQDCLGARVTDERHLRNIQLRQALQLIPRRAFCGEQENVRHTRSGL